MNMAVPRDQTGAKVIGFRTTANRWDGDASIWQSLPHPATTPENPNCAALSAIMLPAGITPVPCVHSFFDPITPITSRFSKIERCHGRWEEMSSRSASCIWAAPHQWVEAAARGQRGGLQLSGRGVPTCQAGLAEQCIACGPGK
jgi:hypothetical protein